MVLPCILTPAVGAIGVAIRRLSQGEEGDYREASLYNTDFVLGHYVINSPNKSLRCGRWTAQNPLIQKKGVAYSCPANGSV
jgi:hypothetical protein